MRRDELEEQVGGFSLKRELEQFYLQLSGVVSLSQAGYPFGGRGEGDAVASLAGADTQCGHAVGTELILIPRIVDACVYGIVRRCNGGSFGSSFLCPRSAPPCLRCCRAHLACSRVSARWWPMCGVLNVSALPFSCGGGGGGGGGA
jgi:hypothetical protein